jgi:hypothetical protein
VGVRAEAKRVGESPPVAAGSLGGRILQPGSCPRTACTCRAAHGAVECGWGTHHVQRQQEIDVPRGDPGSDPHSYAARDHPPAGERGSGPCARPSGLRPLLTALPIVGCGGPPAQGSSPARPAVSRPVHTTPGLVSPGLPATTRLPRSPCRGRDQVASTRGIRPGQWLTLILDDASTAPRPGALPLGGSSVGEWRAAARRRWGLVPRAAPIVLNALHARLLVAGLL